MSRAVLVCKPLPNLTCSLSVFPVSADQCMLLDSGEGAYGQLCHHYGHHTPTLLRRLTAVFISHLHADHHMVSNALCSPPLFSLEFPKVTLIRNNLQGTHGSLKRS